MDNDYTPSQRHDQSNPHIEQNPQSFPRWKKRFSLPWSRRGSHSQSGATEDEILAAMKEANRDWSPARHRGESDSGLPDFGQGVDPTDLSYASPFQFATRYHRNSNSNRSQLRYSQHQQQDSVSSMQQFYHLPQIRDEDELLYDRGFGSDPDQPSRPTLRLQGSYYSTAEQSVHPLSDHEYDPPSPCEEHDDDDDRSQTHNEPPHLSQGQQSMLIVHKSLSKLARQSHSYSESLASNSTLSSVALSTVSSSPIVTLCSRSTTDVSQAPILQPYSPSPSSVTAATHSPSSPATLNATQQNSPSSSMTDKLKALKKMTSMTSLKTLVRLPSSSNIVDEPHIAIDIDCSERKPSSSNVNTQLGSRASEMSPAMYTPSQVSASHSSITLAASQECTVYELEGEEACLSCSIPDWATFKAGLLPTSKQARETLMATIVLALVTIALETVLVQRHNSMAASLIANAGPYDISFFRPLTVYYYLFILAEVFAVGLLWDAAIHKNSLQLVAFAVFEWCMVSYSGLQIWQHDQLVKDMGIPDDRLTSLGDAYTRMVMFSQLGVQVTACLGITFLAWRLYSEFGWLVFQKLGADVSLRKMMKEYRLLFTLLKLDAFFFFGYAIQIAVLTDKHWQKGLIEVAFAIPLSAVIIMLGFYALRNENKVTMGGFIACLALLIGYMIYRLVALYQTLTGEPLTDPYFFSRKTMTVFVQQTDVYPLSRFNGVAALTLFMTVLALINAIVMLYNFDKGLKEAMRQYRIRRSGTIRSSTPSTRRMSIHARNTAIETCRMPRTATTTTTTTTTTTAATTIAAGGSLLGGGKRSFRKSRRASKKSLLHCDVSTQVPVMTERWQIE
ncbi:hypothetical protein BGZ98_003291 [Dissophora globulifera]|nr:hypothetical protein BGZ98_003291 [Dissophora globulifera]